MPKEEWGVKRVCPTTGKRFYDLNKDPIVSPYTGETVTLDTGKGSRTLVADKADKSATKKDVADDADEVVLDDDADLVLDDDADVDLDDDDDVLEDDDDTETVALDDLADVAATNDDDD
ncbi:TIGR02300 family protein [Rhodophyticola porphyridii]|uniref:TIGR02300 family protein n=1 Tax=Rhodophyticola porphyridii TaxID=1852017 RepID=A0A3L9Y6B1_9RHOB|nr:TIGR02300 family protein [Rhodophyticola porphyridii]RMA41883.1 TIGR02300 family protein [Rhodophyticola porphyridii]